MDGYIGEKHSFGQQNRGGVSSGKLHHSDPCKIIGVDLFATRDERYGTSIYGSGKSSAGNLFVTPFFWKIENTPSRCRISEYVPDE